MCKAISTALHQRCTTENEEEKIEKAKEKCGRYKYPEDALDGASGDVAPAEHVLHWGEFPAWCRWSWRNPRGPKQSRLCCSTSFCEARMRPVTYVPMGRGERAHRQYWLAVRDADPTAEGTEQFAQPSTPHSVRHPAVKVAKAKTSAAPCMHRANRHRACGGQHRGAR